MSNCLFEAAYEEILHRCNCTPSFHQTGIREYPWICTGTKLLCMKSILQRIGKYNVVSMIKVINIKIPSVIVIYSANHESYHTDCFATSYKSALQVWLFWRNFSKSPIRATANLLSFADMILHDKHQLKSWNCGQKD